MNIYTHLLLHNIRKIRNKTFTIHTLSIMYEWMFIAIIYIRVLGASSAAPERNTHRIEHWSCQCRNRSSTHRHLRLHNL